MTADKRAITREVAQTVNRRVAELTLENGLYWLHRLVAALQFPDAASLEIIVRTQDGRRWSQSLPEDKIHDSRSAMDGLSRAFRGATQYLTGLEINRQMGADESIDGVMEDNPLFADDDLDIGSESQKGGRYKW